jgi:hypothetical protein
MARDTRSVSPDIRAVRASLTTCAVAGTDARRRAELGALLGSIGCQVQFMGAAIQFERLDRVAAAVIDGPSYGPTLPWVVARAHAVLTLPIVVLGGVHASAVSSSPRVFFAENGLPDAALAELIAEILSHLNVDPTRPNGHASFEVRHA